MTTKTETVGHSDALNRRRDSTGPGGTGLRQELAVNGLTALGRALGIVAVATAVLLATTVLPAPLASVGFVGSVLGIAVAAPTLCRWALTGSLEGGHTDAAHDVGSRRRFGA